MVASIAPGFVADRACLTDACLQSGDLLFEIDGRPVGMQGDAHYSAAAALRAAEGRVTLRVRRINARPREGHVTEWLPLPPAAHAARSSEASARSAEDVDESDRDSLYEAVGAPGRCREPNGSCVGGRPSAAVDRTSMATAETAARDKVYARRSSVGLSGVVSTNV